MTEEEIQALKDAKEEAERKATEATEAARLAKEEADKAKGDVTKIVGELTEERRKKQEALDQAKLTTGELSVNDIVEQALKTREEESRKASFNEALNEFKAAKSEFQADSAGLVYSKFEKGLQRFNFSDVQTKEQMKARLEEAYRFLNPAQSNEEVSDYTGGQPNPAPVGDVRNNPSVDEKKVLEMTGMDSDKYKALKAKYGDAFGSLGLN